MESDGEEDTDGNDDDDEAATRLTWLESLQFCP